MSEVEWDRYAAAVARLNAEVMVPLYGVPLAVYRSEWFGK